MRKVEIVTADGNKFSGCRATSRQTSLLSKGDDVVYSKQSELNILSALLLKKSGWKFAPDLSSLSKGDIVIPTSTDGGILCARMSLADQEHFLTLAASRCVDRDERKESALKRHKLMGHVPRAPGKNGLCEVCVRAKGVRKSHRKVKRKSYDPVHFLDVVATDMVVPLQKVSRRGFKWWQTFIDLATGWIEIYPSKSKHSAVTARNFRSYRTWTGSPRVCRSDQGLEFRGVFEDELMDTAMGGATTRRTTVAYKPQQNGACERANRTVAETSRALLIDSGLDDKYWCWSVEAAAFILNRSPRQKHGGKSPYELRFGREPDLSCLRAFGAPCLYRRGKAEWKLGERYTKGVFLGYSRECGGYIVETEPGSGVTVTTRDCRFKPEHVFGDLQEFVGSDGVDDKKDDEEEGAEEEEDVGGSSDEGESETLALTNTKVSEAGKEEKAKPRRMSRREWRSMRSQHRRVKRKLGRQNVCLATSAAQWQNTAA
eukprot:gene278-101_t